MTNEAIDRRARRSVLLLYAANAFLFLLLSFFFLSDPIVKIVGSAAAVVFALLGLKGASPRTPDAISLVKRHRSFVIAALLLIALLQGLLLIIGFTNPCQIVAIPGSTVTVDGKFLARTPDPTQEELRAVADKDSPANIEPWLTTKKNKYWLRWDTHDVRVSKKWYVDARDRSQESVKNISMSVAKLWNLKHAFDNWKMTADQKPLLKIAYGIKELPDDNLPLALAVRSIVEEWDYLWLKAMNQKDDVPHNRIEPYVAVLQVVQEHQTPHVELEIRDWTDHGLKPLRPILDIAQDESNTPLDKIRTNVFSQLLDELAIQGETIKFSPTTSKLDALAQSLRPLFALTTHPVVSLSPPAEGPSSTPIPSATVTASATPALSLTATPNPIQLVDQLKTAATEAVAKNQFDVAMTVQKQLQVTLDKVQTQPSSKQTTELVDSLSGANAAIKTAIKSKSGKGRVYMHIANEAQRAAATNLREKLDDNQFAVIGIQNVGGRAYIPDTTEVRFFPFSNPPATKKAALEIVDILNKNGVTKVKPSSVTPSERDRLQSSDINTHFEIWFARDAFEKD
jgi:hypothetical protein